MPIEADGSLTSLLEGDELALINGIEVWGQFATPNAGDLDINANELFFLCEQSVLDSLGDFSSAEINSVVYTVRRVERGDETGKEALIVLAAP